MNMQTETQSTERPLWQPPLAAVATLFALFLTATAVRRSGFADVGRPVMIALSSAASIAIALYGIKLIVAARARGIASAVAGAVMLALGVITALHVLK